MEKYLQEFEKSRLVIYTAIIGNYDTLKDPEYIDENCDYVCFTDNRELKSDIWQIRLIKDTGETVRKPLRGDNRILNVGL